MRSKDINLYINSPGGSVTAGLAIYDTMQFLKCDVTTYCVGQAASMGAVLLAAGTAGKRFALPNARIMIHQPWGGVQGQASDISIQAKEILRLRDRLNEILAQHTGQDRSRTSRRTPTATSSCRRKTPRPTAWSTTVVEEPQGRRPRKGSAPWLHAVIRPSAPSAARRRPRSND